MNNDKPKYVKLFIFLSMIALLSVLKYFEMHQVFPEIASSKLLFLLLFIALIYYGMEKFSLYPVRLKIAMVGMVVAISLIVICLVCVGY